MVLIVALAEPSSGHQQDIHPSSWAVAVIVWKMLKFAILEAESSGRAVKLPWILSKGMPSSRAKEKAPVWWHRKQVSDLGNYARYRFMVAESTKKSWAHLQGWCSARMLCYCWSTTWQHKKKVIINNGHEQAWVPIAEAACGARLHEEADMRCGLWRMGAPRGVLSSSELFPSLICIPSAQRGIPCYVLQDQAVAWPPKWRVWKVVAQWPVSCGSHFWSMQHQQYPVAHWPLVERQHFGQYGPFLII